MAPFNFDVVTNLPGPNIDVNLYPNAATRGIAAGNAVPSVASSVVQGVSQGVDLYGKIQRIQTEAEEAPFRQKILEEQAEGAEIQNELAILRLKTEQELRGLKDQKEKVELENTLITARQEKEDLENKDAIAQDLVSNDSRRKADIFNNSAYVDTLFRDPKFGEQVAGRLVKEGLLDPAQQKNVFAMLDFSRHMQYQQELAKVEAQQRRSLLSKQSDVFNKLSEGAIPAVKNQFGLSTMDLASERVQTYPAGLKNVNNKTREIDGTKGDNDLASPLADTGLTGKFDVFVDGKLANVRLSDSDNDVVQQWKQIAAAQGLIAPSKTPPSPVAALPRDESKPYSTAFSAASSASPVVQQRAQELIERAKSDPQLMNRLVAKGLLKQDLAQAAAQEYGGRSSMEAQAELREMGGTVTEDTEVQAPTPVYPTTEAPKRVPSMEGATLKKNVSEVHQILPESAKRYVEKPIVEKVLSEPLLKGLDPIYQAVAAVESGGKAAAKGKGTSAVGFFQLTKAAAKDAGVSDREVPSHNVAGGKAYLDQMFAQFGNQEIPSLMAYNIGPSVIRDAIDVVGASDYESILFALNYLKSRGRYERLLTQENLRTVAKYPFKVLAYKEAFSALTNV